MELFGQLSETGVAFNEGYYISLSLGTFYFADGEEKQRDAFLLLHKLYDAETPNWGSLCEYDEDSFYYSEWYVEDGLDGGYNKDGDFFLREETLKREEPKKSSRELKLYGKVCHYGKNGISEGFSSTLFYNRGLVHFTCVDRENFSLLKTFLKDNVEEINFRIQRGLLPKYQFCYEQDGGLLPQPHQVEEKWEDFFEKDLVHYALENGLVFYDYYVVEDKEGSIAYDREGSLYQYHKSKWILVK